MGNILRYIQILGMVLCLGCSTSSESQEDFSAAGDVKASEDLGPAGTGLGERGGDTKESPADSAEQPEDVLADDIEESLVDAAEDPWSEVGAFIEEQMEAAHIPGLAVAVTLPGEVVWAGAYGLANVEENLAATVDTPFMLASVSKTVTATAVMHAWQEGVFSLDTPINSLLPFAVDNPRVDGESIVLRHLLSHTSGIRDNWAQMPYADGDSPYELGVYLKGYLVEGGMWFHPTENFYENMPGTAREYGNIATALAGFVLEVATQTPFDDYCEANIFDVLAMENTGWHLADFDASLVAMPYEKSGGAYEAVGHYGYADYPDGQLRSSVSDMARFLAAVTNHGELGEARILNSETVAEMLSPQFPTVDNGQFIFWYSATTAGRAVVAHNGGDQGVATEVAFSPETGAGVIILMNVPWGNGVTNAAVAIQSLLFERAEAH